MKVTIYTTNDCKFSQAEKDYLKTNNISFEEKNVEQDRNFLTEMLSISENFAGTPVTKIEKDDGTSIVIKGFTKEEFDKELDSAPATKVPPDNTAAPSVPPATPAVDEPSALPLSTPPTPPKDIKAPTPAPTSISEPHPEDTKPISLSENTTTPPADTQTMPISLSDNPSSPTPPPTTPTPPPLSSNVASNQPAATQPAPQPKPAPQPTPVAPAPNNDGGTSLAPDQLNSVLKNLQNQVNTTVPSAQTESNTPAKPAPQPTPVAPVPKVE